MSIVIPVRDGTGLPPMFRGLPVADEVIVVTAGPAQDDAVLAACPRARVVRQTRTGPGNALACGFAAGTGDVVVALDGDGATDPGELPRYVDALVAGADVALGSRYRPGGRDLTAGRFRARLDRVLIWLVNVLYGVRRTDPGFGYVAAWRDTLDDLALPSPAGPACWGDGPEIQALITVRTAARGLAVTEVPGVAYPRLRRTSRAGRTTLRHWLRALATEFGGRTRRPPRHAAPAVPTPHPGAIPSSAGPEPGGRATQPMKPPADSRSWPARLIPERIDPAASTGPGRSDDDGAAASGDGGIRPLRIEPGADRRSFADRRLAMGGRRTKPGAPADHDRGRADLGPAALSGPLDRAPAERPREVGGNRRHLEGYRARPDLRVINGEGNGSGRTSSGRLRSVPRETTGGIPPA